MGPVEIVSGVTAILTLIGTAVALYWRARRNRSDDRASAADAVRAETRATSDLVALVTAHADRTDARLRRAEEDVEIARERTRECEARSDRQDDEISRLRRQIASLVYRLAHGGAIPDTPEELETTPITGIEPFRSSAGPPPPTLAKAKK